MCVCISPKEKGGGCVCVCETGSVHAHIREMRKTLARQSVGKKEKCLSLFLCLRQQQGGGRLTPQCVYEQRGTERGAACVSI